MRLDEGLDEGLDDGLMGVRKADLHHHCFQCRLADIDLELSRFVCGCRLVQCMEYLGIALEFRSGSHIGVSRVSTWRVIWSVDSECRTKIKAWRGVEGFEGAVMGFEGVEGVEGAERR
eukprot:gene17795-biopygen5371